MTSRTLAITASLALATAAALPLAPTASAQNVASFVVANDDGYGVDTCLAAGDTCGRQIATAWCVANGYRRAVEVRRQTALDITGPIGGPTQVAATAEPHAVVITCEK